MGPGRNDLTILCVLKRVAYQEVGMYCMVGDFGAHILFLFFLYSRALQSLRVGTKAADIV